MARDLIVNRENLNESKITDAVLPDRLITGQAKIKIDRFALTANNITYGTMGQAFGYWDFFPSTDGWGRIPVWGYGNVVESACNGVTVGDRLYGYWPMSDYLIVDPIKVRPRGWTDGIPHRDGLPPIYNHYTNTAHDPLYDANLEPERMALGPLFSTSFVLTHYLQDKDYFGTAATILTSASSKTAIGSAFMLSQMKPADHKIAGITSARNTAFVQNLPFYDKVYTYDRIDAIAPTSAALIDFSGNRSIIQSVHEKMGDNLKYSAAIGATHWETIPGKDATLETAGAGLPGPKSTMFHAPNEIQKRYKDWGSDGYALKFNKYWSHFADTSRQWLTIEEGRGLEAAQSVCNTFLTDNAEPNKAYIIKL